MGQCMLCLNPKTNSLEWMSVEWNESTHKWEPTGQTISEMLGSWIDDLDADKLFAQSKTPADVSAKPKQAKQNTNKMSEPQPIEPLEFDEEMDDVDTEYPILKPGIYDLEVQGPITKTRNKADTGDNAVIKYKTVDEAESTKDKPIKPGLVLTEWYPLQSIDKDTGEPTKKWKENFARLFDHALNTTKETRPRLAAGIQALPGALVRARIITETDDNGVMRNRIASFMKRADEEEE